MTNISRKIDVDDRGSLEKAQVIQALQDSGDADYDSVRLSPFPHISLILVQHWVIMAIYAAMMCALAAAESQLTMAGTRDAQGRQHRLGGPGRDGGLGPAALASEKGQGPAGARDQQGQDLCQGHSRHECEPYDQRGRADEFHGSHQWGMSMFVDEPERRMGLGKEGRVSADTVWCMRDLRRRADPI